jgi:iron complex transport system substrate-binding protein
MLSAQGGLFGGPVFAKSISVTDDLNRKVTLTKPAERLIALYGAYNEILVDMGLERKLIARTSADKTPESMLAKPSIGTHMRPNVELIMGLKPDLIIQNAGRKEALVPVRQLMSQGLPVAVFNTNSFADLFSVIERLAILTGSEERGARLIYNLKQKLELVKNRISATKKRPSVLFEVRYPDILLAGQDSIVNEVIKLAGGRNSLTSEKKFLRSNIEEILRLNPDFYVVQRGPMNRDPGPIEQRPHFYQLDAIKNQRFFIVEEQVFSRPGPRSVTAVEDLSRKLHPEQWKLQDKRLRNEILDSSQAGK